MFEFITIILICVVFWLYTKISNLQEKVRTIEKKLSQHQTLQPTIEKEVPPTAIDSATTLPKNNSDKQHIWQNTPPPHKEPQERSIENSQKINQSAKSKFKFNENFISKLPIWIGGIACFLAAFYFIKYSIDHNLIGPWGQCIIASLFGFGLLTVADKIRFKPSFHHHILLSQSITGAGLMVLYAVCYAAAHFYNLIPLVVGFLAMTAVTLMAVLLSLRHGYPIAMMALIAAFVSPALFSSGQGSAPALFSYLFILFSGFMFLCYKQGWKLLSYITIAFSFLWILIWLNRSVNPFDSTIISLFLIGISSAIVMIEHKILKSDMNDVKKFFLTPSMLVVLCSVGIFALNFLFQSDLSYYNLFLYALLSLATMALAYFSPQQYRYYPFISLSLIFVLFLVHDIDNTEHYTAFILLASVLMATSALLWNKTKKDLWARILTYSASGFFTLYVFNHFYSSWLSAQDILPFQIFIIGALLCSFLIQSTKQALLANNMNAISSFAGGITFILALSSAYTLPEFTILGVLSCQILALIWINSYIPIKSLKLYVYGLLYSVVIIMSFIISIEIIGSIHIALNDIIALLSITLPLFIAPFLLRTEQYIKLKKHLEVISLSFVTITICALFFAILNDLDIHTLSKVFSLFNSRAILFNILYILSLSFCVLGLDTQRNSYKDYGVGLISITAILHILCDYLLFNPLLTEQSIAGTYLINMLLMSYIIPFFYGCILWKQIVQTSDTPNILMNISKKYLYIVPTLVILFWISLNIRFTYAGYNQMHHAAFENNEIYTYSVIWLLYAASLMLLGIFKNIHILRQISLGLMLLVAAKVFLFDASELAGLWRVASFLGLGLSLIAISWLYGFTTKHITHDKQHHP